MPSKLSNASQSIPLDDDTRESRSSSVRISFKRAADNAGSEIEIDLEEVSVDPSAVITTTKATIDMTTKPKIKIKNNKQRVHKKPNSKSQKPPRSPKPGKKKTNRKPTRGKNPSVDSETKLIDVEVDHEFGSDDDRPMFAQWASSNGFAEMAETVLNDPAMSRVTDLSKVGFEDLTRLGLHKNVALSVRVRLSQSVRGLSTATLTEPGNRIHRGTLLIRKRRWFVSHWYPRHVLLDLEREEFSIARNKPNLRVSNHNNNKTTYPLRRIARVVYPVSKDHRFHTSDADEVMNRVIHLHIRKRSSPGKTHIVAFLAPSESDAKHWASRIRERVYIYARLYQVTPGLVYPERALGVKPTVGICFGGGGGRSYAATIGQLRALHSLGLMDRIPYCSAVSAGAWATAAYTFYNSGAANDDELLGVDYTPDGDLSLLSMAYLGNPSCPMVIPPTKNLFTLATNLVFRTNGHELWERMVAEVFLQPFGIGFEGETFALPKTVDDILKLNPHMEAEDIVVANADRPFWIANATIIGPDWAKINENLAPIQFTGMYSGSPVSHHISYEPKGGGSKREVTVGGGLLDTFAFGTSAPALPRSRKTSAASSNNEMAWAPNALKLAWQRVRAELASVEADMLETIQPIAEGAALVLAPAMGPTSPSNLGKLVPLERPTKLFGLAHAVGIASAAPGVRLKHTYLGNHLSPQEAMWGPEALKRGAKKDDESSGTNVYDLTDGASLDNTGLIAMLQRGVRSNVVFLNSRLSIPLTEQEELEDKKDKKKKKKRDRKIKKNKKKKKNSNGGEEEEEQQEPEEQEIESDANFMYSHNKEHQGGSSSDNNISKKSSSDSSLGEEEEEEEEEDDNIDYKALPNMDILSLFGMDITPDMEWMNAFGHFGYNQVFARADLHGLLAKLRELAHAGKPLVVEEEYVVQTNEWWGIKGGWTAKILWVYLHRADEFESQLPQEVREEVIKGEEGVFGHFPNYRTLNENATRNNHWADSCLSIPQVNLLSSFTEWTILHNKEKFENFINKGLGKGSNEIGRTGSQHQQARKESAGGTKIKRRTSFQHVIGSATRSSNSSNNNKNNKTNRGGGGTGSASMPSF